MEESKRIEVWSKRLGDWMDGQSERGMKQTLSSLEFKEPLEHQREV